jgi:osmotically-inducible protein OsmY
MEYTRIQVVMGGGSWKRGTRVTGAIEGPARAVLVDPSDFSVTDTIVSPRRARALPPSVVASQPGVLELGRAVVAASLDVRAMKESVGHVSRIWCRVDTRRITHLVVRERAGWPRQGQERIVPADYVDAVTEAGIALKCTGADFHVLPLYRPDEAILADVQAALESVLADPRARRQVKARVDDGQVTLAGEVDTIDQARLAERAVATVPGVRAIVEDLVAQESLASVVEARIAALGQAVMNGHGPIQVYSEHGIVYLEGSVPSAQARQDAEQAALAAAGTKVVVNNLRISGEPPERGPGTGPLVRNR